MTRAALPLLVAAAGAAAQSAPAVDPVVAHFLEYRAALERNDLVGAEAAGAAALAASEQTQGRRTAVLALNLADVRLNLGNSFTRSRRPKRTLRSEAPLTTRPSSSANGRSATSSP